MFDELAAKLSALEAKDEALTAEVKRLTGKVKVLNIKTRISKRIALTSLDDAYYNYKMRR